VSRPHDLRSSKNRADEVSPCNSDLKDALVLSADQRHVHQVLGLRNHTCNSLAQGVADRQVVGPVVPNLSARSASSRHSPDDDLWASSRRESCTGTSSRPPRRPCDPCGLGDVVGHGEAHAPQQLNALESCHQFRLLAVVLIE